MRLFRRFSWRGVARIGAATTFVLAVASVIAAKTIPRAQIAEMVPENSRRTVQAILAPPTDPIRRVAVSDPKIRKIIAAAHAQEGDAYDASYRKLAFPNGDVAKGRGACTDVVVRSLRGAGLDLQKLVNEDMKRDFGRYPNSWGLNRTDKNIDHRRVPNLITFFEKWGQTLPIGTSKNELKNWKPGDIVTWRLDDGRWHIGLISDGIGPRGWPLVIHNAYQCAEQDYLDAWQIKGHYRFPKS